MAIPDYQTLMLPLLRGAADGAEQLFRDAVDRLAEHFSLTHDERSELLPGGNANVFGSRVGWARTYLKQAGLLQAPRRGVLQITPAGHALLTTNPARIDNKLLDKYEAFRSFRARGRDGDDGTARSPSTPAAATPPLPDAPEADADTAPETQTRIQTQTQTPEDAMAAAYLRLRRSLETELLEAMKRSTPAFFERLVVDLIVAMGYGGSRRDAGRAVGQSHDGGIDGIIKEDKLGLDVIDLQAKKWDGTVGRPEVQKFAGALQGQRATKGILITTGAFSREAAQYVDIIATKIILIDGDTLAQLMVDHDVGVATAGTYALKRIDSDYFEGG